MIPHRRFTPLRHVDFDAIEAPHIVGRSTHAEHHASAYCWCKSSLESGLNDRGGCTTFYYHRAVH